MMKTIQEEYQAKLNDFKEMIIDSTQEMFKEHGGIDPTVFGLVIKDGTLHIGILGGLGEMFVSDEGKDVAAQIIKKMSKELKPIALAFISEAWASENPGTNYDAVVDKDGNYREGVVRPIDDPNRKEILFINFETHDKEAFIQWDMVPKGEEKVLELKISSDWDKKREVHLRGRFSGLLEENYSELAKMLGDKLKDSKN